MRIFWDLPIPDAHSSTDGIGKFMNKKQKAALRLRFSGTGKSSGLFVDVLETWYDAKHPRPSAKEVEYLNRLVPQSCPFCGGPFCKDVRKKDGTQRYRCSACGKRFTVLTGTIFDSRKIPISEWIEFLMHLFEYHSTRTSAKDNRNAVSTGKYWLSKAFLILKDFQDDTRLSGMVYIDETYVPLWKSKRERKPDGKEIRGISRNQCCICAGTDGRKSFFLAEGKGKPSEKRGEKAYSPHISDGSTVIHNGEKAHMGFIKSRGFSEAKYPTSATKGLDDKSNPLEPINRVHANLKKFLSRHGGYSREEL